MKTNIAIVYDRATVSYGGAEQVILALQKIYPQAVLFSSIYDPQKALWANSFEVKTSFIQNIPFSKKLYRYLAFLMPLAFENLDLSPYEIIISITSAEAKGVITRRDQLHLCYLLSPPRYLYHYQNEYLRKNKILNLFFIRPLAQKILDYLKKWDQIAIFRPDIIVPIAEVVAKRSLKYYPKLKTAQVIYPPVNAKLPESLQNHESLKPKEKYFLLVGRLVPYKHIDAAILACQKMGLRLVVVGEGPEKEKLKRLVKTKLITFREKVSAQELAYLYEHCQAVLNPGLDDFSIAALEANVFGKPVIINQRAGAAEIIVHKKHGLHMRYEEGQSLTEITLSLIDSLQLLQKQDFDPEQLRKNALKYDTNKFARNFDETLRQAYQAKLKGHL